MPPVEAWSEPPPAGQPGAAEGAFDEEAWFRAYEPDVPLRGADVCMLVEGTYPYVPGGVSSWVHDIIQGTPERTFELVNIGSHPGAYGGPRFDLPANVRGLRPLFCRTDASPPPGGPERRELERRIRATRRRAARASTSRVLQALERLHLDGPVDDRLLADLSAADLDLGAFLYGAPTFELLQDLGRRLAPQTSFLDLFWHFRAMHAPILRLLSGATPIAGCYHAVSTGYAGLLGAVWSYRTGRPLVVTEHGIYTREREMELARSDWIRDDGDADRLVTYAPALSALRRLWSRLFRKLAQVAYHRAERILTLSAVNQRKQIADGAAPAKIEIIPNGVEVKAQQQPPPSTGPQRPGAVPDEPCPAPLRVGFVGRVVPIKDLITFIAACDLALREVPLDVRIIGPDDEDPAYAKRCKDLVASLHRRSDIRFVGPMPAACIYSDLDVLVLTSFSEGQPLVILEGYAASVPAIATDVGACREMIEGLAGADAALGPSGVVTRVAVPEDTAAALVLLARDGELRRRLGQAGQARVSRHYLRQDMLNGYRRIYRRLATEWPA